MKVDKEKMCLIVSISLVLVLFSYAIIQKLNMPYRLMEETITVFEIYEPELEPNYTWIHTYGKGIYLLVDQEIEMEEGKTYVIAFYNVKYVCRQHINLIAYWEIE